MNYFNRIALFLVSIAVLWLMSAGCISHKFFIDLTPGGTFSYILEGDSLDLNDDRIKFPPGPPWNETLYKREKDEKGNITWTYGFEAASADVVPHPICPPEKQGSFQVRKNNFLLVKRTSFTALFPGWDVTDTYGDLREFVPPEVEKLKSSDEDTTEKAYLQRLEALGLQKATARRYMFQVQNMLLAWQHRQELEDIDSVMVNDGLKRFSSVLQGLMLTFREKDPLEVSLEWYHELRESMISVCMEVTNGSEEWFTHAADSIDFRWKTWMDMEDDGIELKILLPSTWKQANPDTTVGDTLYWSIESDDLADNNIMIRAAGWTPVLWADGLLLLILAGVVFILFRSRKKDTRTTQNESRED